jgi:N-acetylneuraminate synthase
MKIKLNDKKEIYNFCEPYIIAEIGANHNGDISLAKELIDAAKKCGADCVKFQSWTPKSLIAKEEYDRNQSYDDGDGGKKHFGSLKEMVEKYYLNESQHKTLKAYCDKVGIDFCSTPFSYAEVDLLENLGVSFFKVASMDINNVKLLQYIATKQKPVVLSTGMATLAEIDNAVKTIENAGNRQIVLLHCISIYPPDPKDINLRNISMLQKTFGYPVGFSDHTMGTSVPLASVVLGASIIEKHFTLDKDMPGWDHAISADPDELKVIVEDSKLVNESLGNFPRVVSVQEEEKKFKFRRSIVTQKMLQSGAVISEEDLVFKRPGTGIPPDQVDFVIGRKLKNTLQEDTVIKWEDFE